MIDPAQLATSFDAYAATLVLFAHEWLVRSAAEDVVQDVFVNLLLQRRAPDNLKAWLFIAVRNAAISHARSATRRGNREKRHAVHRPDWFEPRPEDLIDAATAQQRRWNRSPPSNAKSSSCAICGADEPGRDRRGDRPAGLDALQPLPRRFVRDQANHGVVMPSEEEPLNPVERELEAGLSALSPVRPGIGFPQIHAQGVVLRERHRTRFWRAVAALLALAAGASFLVRPAPRVVEVERTMQRDHDTRANPR